MRSRESALIVNWYDVAILSVVLSFFRESFAPELLTFDNLYSSNGA